jgi:hypothetical protein
MTNEIRFLSKGRFIDKEEARKRPIMVVGSILPDDRLAQTFDSDEEFHKWIDHTPHAEKVHQIEKAVAQVRKRQHEDHTQSQRRLKATVDRVTRELHELAARHQLDPREAGYELFVKATVERDPMDPPIFDPAMLYEHVGAKGDCLPLLTVVPYADLSYLLWNDRASSVAVYGAGFLWEDPWFTGAKILFYGAPWAFNLTDYGWNDRASSAYIA